MEVTVTPATFLDPRGEHITLPDTEPGSLMTEMSPDELDGTLPGLGDHRRRLDQHDALRQMCESQTESVFRLLKRLVTGTREDGWDLSHSPRETEWGVMAVDCTRTRFNQEDVLVHRVRSKNLRCPAWRLFHLLYDAKQTTAHAIHSASVVDGAFELMRMIEPPPSNSTGRTPLLLNKAIRVMETFRFPPPPFPLGNWRRCLTLRRGWYDAQENAYWFIDTTTPSPLIRALDKNLEGFSHAGEAGYARSQDAQYLLAAKITERESGYCSVTVVTHYHPAGMIPERQVQLHGQRVGELLERCAELCVDAMWSHELGFPLAPIEPEIRV